MSNRLLVVVPLALVVTAALFFLMKDLIGRKAALPDETPVEEVIIARPDRDPPPETEPPGPKPPQPEPPQPEPITDRPVVPPGSKGIPVGPGPGPIDPGPIGKLNGVDGPALAIIRPAPPYPPNCGQGGGTVVLEFYVDARGNVFDIKTVTSTASCFARAAERAAARWQYRPRVENGKAVRSRLQRVTVQFIPE